MLILDEHACHRALRELGYAVDCLLAKKPNRRTYRVMSKSERFALKLFSPDGEQAPYPVEAHRHVLPHLTNANFEVLATPHLVEWGKVEELWFVVMTWLAGANFDDRWHSHRRGIAGGAGLSPCLAERCCAVLSDLEQSRYSGLAEVRTTDPPSIATMFSRSLERTSRWLPVSVMTEVGELGNWLGREALCEPATLSNEDFRLRNMVEMLDGKLGLVDWDGARRLPFESTFCVAYLWISMWGNLPWRQRLLAAARERLGLREDVFRAALAERSLNQFYVWRADPALARMQQDNLALALNDSSSSRLWK